MSQSFRCRGESEEAGAELRTEHRPSLLQLAGEADLVSAAQHDRLYRVPFFDAFANINRD